jgi:hypothetical protein
MKALFVLLILLGGAAAMSAHAQSPSQTQAPGAAPAASQHSPTEVVEMLGKRLSLSDARRMRPYHQQGSSAQ